MLIWHSVRHTMCDDNFDDRIGHHHSRNRVIFLSSQLHSFGYDVYACSYAGYDAHNSDHSICSSAHPHHIRLTDDSRSRRLIDHHMVLDECSKL